MTLKRSALQRHSIYDKNRHLIVNIEPRLIFHVDDIGYEMINYLKNKSTITIYNLVSEYEGKWGREEIESVVKEMLAFKIIYEPEKPPKKIDWTKRFKMTPPDFYPRNVCLNVTHKCNLGCKYCYGDGGSFGSPGEDMSLDVGIKVVDWLVNNIKTIGAKSGELIFFGGEPLLNFKLIPSLAHYALDEAVKNNIKISFAMTTNGTLITEEISKELVELGINPMISIDGPPEIQNYQRPYADGRPSYDDCIKGAKVFMKTAKRRISARATYASFDLVKIAGSLYKEGFRNVFLSGCSGPFGDHLRNKEGVEATLKGFEELYIKYSELLNSKDYPALPYNNVLIKILKSISTGDIAPWPCGAGRSYVGISPNGSIYTCHRFVGNEEFYMGNVITGELKKDLYRKIIENAGARKGKCEKCWVRFYCPGGCFQHNYAHTGNMFISSESECELTKRLTEIGIKFFFHFYKNNPELLKKICEEKPPVEHENEMPVTNKAKA